MSSDVCFRAQIFNFLMTPGIDSLESIPLWKGFLEASNPLCGGGEDIPIGQHISYTQTIWQLSAGNEKLIPILRNMANSVPYLVPTLIKESIFSPVTRPKNRL